MNPSHVNPNSMNTFKWWSVRRPTFCNCVSNLLHSSFFCSMAISRDLSLDSFFRLEEARDVACSFKSMRLDYMGTSRNSEDSQYQTRRHSTVEKYRTGQIGSYFQREQHPMYLKCLCVFMQIRNKNVPHGDNTINDLILHWPPSLLIPAAGCWPSPWGPCSPSYKTPLHPSSRCPPSLSAPSVSL